MSNLKECKYLLAGIFALNIAIIGSGSLYTATAGVLQLVSILLLGYNLNKLKN